MELHLGFMSCEELAQWFGTTSGTNLSKHKKAFLAKLQSFAKFSDVRGGVKIEEILIPEYVKNLDNDVKLYKDVVAQQPNHLTSITKIVEELMTTNEDFSNASYATVKYRMSEAGKKAFGQTSTPGSHGIYGWREYVWCIKLYSGPQHYRYFTEEEKQLFDQLTASYYTEEADKVQKAALLETAFKDTDMTKEEYLNKKELLGLNLFSNIIHLFKQQTGLQIVRATRHEIENSLIFQ